MKIAHIITSLDDGGAEHTLFKICKYENRNEHLVISLKDSGKYYKPIKNLGIKIFCLNFSKWSIFKFFHLIKILKQTKPDVLQTWLVHSDFIGSFAGKLAGIHNIVWNIRYSNFNIKSANLITIILVKILAIMSFYFPKLIIINSIKAKKIYIKNGYDEKKLKFIPNGFDLSILKFNNKKKKIFQKKIRIKKNTVTIGNVARFNPKKDHLNLIKALSIIRSENINFQSILVGTNINKKNKKLISEIKNLKLQENIKLLGQKNDISKVMSSIDIYVQSSSYGEGFPNVLAEAMACKIPCVATDVGDASHIIGNSGWIVPAKNPYKLAKAIKKAIYENKLKKKWRQRGIKARNIIRLNFSIEKMILSYIEIWNSVFMDLKNTHNFKND